MRVAGQHGCCSNLREDCGFAVITRRSLFEELADKPAQEGAHEHGGRESADRDLGAGKKYELERVHQQVHEQGDGVVAWDCVAL